MSYIALKVRQGTSIFLYSTFHHSFPRHLPYWVLRGNFQATSSKQGGNLKECRYLHAYYVRICLNVSWGVFGWGGVQFYILFWQISVNCTAQCRSWNSSDPLFYTSPSSYCRHWHFSLKFSLIASVWLLAGFSCCQTVTENYFQAWGWCLTESIQESNWCKALNLCYVSVKTYNSHIFYSGKPELKEKKLGRIQDLENLRFLYTSNFVCEGLELPIKSCSCPTVQRKTSWSSQKNPARLLEVSTGM